MNRFIATFIVAVIPFFGMAQKSKVCKGVKLVEQTDAFSGKSIVGFRTAFTIAFPFTFSINSENYIINASLRFNEIREEIIQKGDTLAFALNNGEIVNLIAEENALPVTNANQYGITTFYSPVYKANRETFERMGESGIRALKIYIGPKYYQTEVSEKKQEKFQKSMTCLLDKDPQIK